MFLRGISPATRGHKRGSNGGEFFIVEDANGALLDVDDVTGIDQGLSCGGGKSRAMLQRLVLGSKVKVGRRHGKQNECFSTEKT